MNVEHRTLNVQHRIRYSVNLKTEQYESTPRYSTRLLLTGSSPELAEGRRSILSYSIMSPSVVSSGLNTQGLTTHNRGARRRFRFVCFKKSIKRSVINIRRSMLDVRCSTFKAFSPPLLDSLFRPGRISYLQNEVS